MQQKILFITTSHTELGNTGRKTGIWAEEVAIPYLVFRDAGYQVDIASPKGGAALFDPSSVKPIGQNGPALERFLADKVAQESAQHTQALTSVSPADYAAVFVPGGHGAMWDLPQDADAIRILERTHADGKIIGAVCHGVAALVGVRAVDGKPLVKGRRVNSFTDEEEDAAGLSQVVPFNLETCLRELGGRFEKSANWASFGVRDGALVTGQNPASSERVAQLVLQALQDKPASAAV